MSDFITNELNADKLKDLAGALIWELSRDLKHTVASQSECFSNAIFIKDVVHNIEWLSSIQRDDWDYGGMEEYFIIYNEVKNTNSNVYKSTYGSGWNLFCEEIARLVNLPVHYGVDINDFIKNDSTFEAWNMLGLVYGFYSPVRGWLGFLNKDIFTFIKQVKT